MKYGHICWNCHKRFERDENEEKITVNGKQIYCSCECLDACEFEISQFILKSYDYN